MELKFRTLRDLFNLSLEAVESFDKPCLEILRVNRRETVTFSRLQTKARDFATWLIQDARIRTKDKIAILGKNRTDWDIAFWAAVLAGAVPVLIDPERPIAGVIQHILHTNTRLVITADDYQDADSRQQLRDFAANRDIGLIEMTDAPLPAAQRTDAARLHEVTAEVTPDDTAVILCTSGTTADPREVELTHDNLISNIRGCLQRIDISSSDKLGHILPPHHCFGLTVGKLLPFCVGATSIYTNKYRQVAEIIKEENVTIFVAVPALFTVTAKTIEENLSKEKAERPFVRFLDRRLPRLIERKIKKKLGWTSLRFSLSGSAPVPRWVLNVFWKRGLPLYEGYGTTENSPVYGFNDDTKRLGSVGRPISTILVRIVDDNNKTLKPGEKGEILLGGACIMKGYYKNDRATEAVIETDDKGTRWLHTGDLGYLDKKSNLYITGRKKYLIVLPGGKNVNPELVEAALSEARFVGEILVVPTLHKTGAGDTREAVRAIVKPAWNTLKTHTNLSCAQLTEQPKLLRTLIWQSISECQKKNRHLSHFEKVSARHLEIRIDEFQRTSTGKIKREVYMNL